MDLQSALICGAVFLVSGAVLLFISWIGIKQKSYEEALAEQRDLNSGLLETRAKLKLAKEKKLRKQEKRKNREKTSTASSSDITGDEEVQESKTIPSVVVKPGHVDFKEQPAVIPTDLSTKVNRKSKRDQSKLNVKPILINRDPSPVITHAPIDSPKTMNHFDLIHPKDEKELLKPQTEKPGKTTKKQNESDKTVEKPVKVTKLPEPEVKTKTSPKPKTEPKPVVKKEQPEILKNKPTQKVEKKKSPQPEKTPPQPEKAKKEVIEKAKVEEEKTGDNKVKKGTKKEENKVVNGQKKKEENVKKESPPIKKNKKEVELVQVKKEQNGLANGYKEMIEESVVAVQANTVAKESKKRKRELNALQQMSGDSTGVNVSLLVPLIRKAELSRSEVQILIDLLLNKQHDTPSLHEEWFEGRSDPVVKLKKQLAERVKQFEAEQEAHAGVAAKLREVRSELNACLQAKRQIEDVNTQALNERQQIIARLQLNQDHWQGEKQMLQKQIQQLQTKFTEEKQMARQFKEELSKLQSQRQQLEVAVNRLSEQHQESDNALKSQIGNLHKELQDQRNITASLRLDLHAVGTDADTLRERLSILQPAAEQSQELARQLEDARLTISELETRLTVTVNNAQVMNEKLNHLEEIKNNAQTEVHNLQSDLSRLHTLAKQKQDESENTLTQLRAELSTVQANATGSAENDKARKVEILNLHNQLDSTLIELKAAKEQIEDEKTKNNELRERSWKVIEALKIAEKAKEDGAQLLDDTIIKLKTENQEQNKQVLLRLFPEVSINSNLKYDKFITDYEKAIHNYISSKTIDIEMKSQQTQQKLKEQFATSEKENQLKIKGLDEKLKQLTISDKENQKKVKELEEKLKLETTKINDQSIKQVESKKLEKKLKELEEKQKAEADKVSEKEKLLIDAKEEIVSLQETVTKYKSIIEDAESMLNKLEKNIGSEVTTMKAELLAKDEQLKIGTVFSQDLQKQLNAVREDLIVERRRNQILVDECQNLKSKNLTNSNNSFHNHEDIKEKTCKMVAVEQIKSEKPKNSVRPEKLQTTPNSNSSLGDSNESHSPPSPALSNTSQTNSSNKTKKKKSKK